MPDNQPKWGKKSLRCVSLLMGALLWAFRQTLVAFVVALPGTRRPKPGLEIEKTE